MNRAPMCVSQVIHRDGQGVEQVEAIIWWRMTNASTAVVQMDRFFLSMMKVIPDHARAIELQYRVSFFEATGRGIVDIMMPLRYVPKQWRSSFIRSVRFVSPAEEEFRRASSVESLGQGLAHRIELGISRLDSDTLHATRIRFVVVVIKAADFYIGSSTESTVFHVTSFYQFSDQLLNKLIHQYDECSVLMKTRFVAFTNERLAKSPDEVKLINHLYFNSTWLSEYDARDKKATGVESGGSVKSSGVVCLEVI